MCIRDRGGAGSNWSRTAPYIARHDGNLRQGRYRYAGGSGPALAGVFSMMHRHVDRYINLHRALGKGFNKHEKSLRDFAAFAAGQSDQRVTAALILEWASSAATPNSAQDRYDQARACAMVLHAEDAQHEVPVAGLFGRSRRRRPAPHILSLRHI